MSARLARWVHLSDARGRRHSFGPGSSPPAWAQRLIRNRAAWESPPARQPRVRAVAPPPRSGPGSGLRAWQDYAALYHVDTAGLSREELIASLEEQGVFGGG